jgi:hypothetical protein
MRSIGHESGDEFSDRLPAPASDMMSSGQYEDGESVGAATLEYFRF